MKKTLLTLALAFAVSLGAPVFADDKLPAEEARAIEKAKELEKSITTLVAKVSPAYVVIGGGSGVVVTPDGYMLTNHHVAGSKPVGQTWRVKIAGRGILDAKVIGHDATGDITLLKLEGKDFTYVPIGDSDSVKVGDYSLALGNPFGYAKDSTPTVTQGVVSAVHRNQGAYSDAIQTDAPINPGNSGGPLINKQGELMGINGRIAVRNGVKINTGVGYAIPANQIVRFMESFKKDGVVHHGYVSGLRVSNPREGSGGAVVGEVSRDAEAAGFKKGDIIVEADGRPVPHASRFHGIVGTIPAGEKIKVKVRRGEETVDLEIALAKQGGGDAANADPPANPNGTYLGLRMKASDSGMVEVEEVVENSPAAEAGLKPGDLISHFGRRKVTNVNEMITQIARRRPGDKVTLSVKRDGHQIEVTVTLGKRTEK